MKLVEQSYTTRSAIRTKVTENTSPGDEITFTNNVEFISRAVADELLALAVKHDLRLNASDARSTVQTLLLTLDSNRESNVSLNAPNAKTA